MSDLKPEKIKVKLGGKEYGLLFSINAIDEVQDRFDIPIAQLVNLLQEEKKMFKALRFILTILINEAIDDDELDQPHLNEKFVGLKVTATNFVELRTSVLQAFTGSIQEAEEDNNPNVMSEQ